MNRQVLSIELILLIFLKCQFTDALCNSLHIHIQTILQSICTRLQQKYDKLIGLYPGGGGGGDGTKYIILM